MQPVPSKLTTTSHGDLVQNDKWGFSGNDYSLEQEESSFASVYAQLQASGDSVRFLWHWTPEALGRVAQPHVTALLSHETRPWRLVRVFLLRNGFCDTLANFTLAILVNHIRQMLVPEIGTFVYPEPMENLGLAWTNPSVFLEQEISVPWSVLLASGSMKLAVDIAYRLADAVMTRLAHRHGATMMKWHPDARNPNDQWWRRAWQTCQVVWLTLNLLQLEYIFARWLHTTSCLLAYGSLVQGGDVSRGTLRRILLGAHGPSFARLLVHIWQLLWFVRHGMLPVLESALVAAIRRRPGALLVLVSVAHATSAPVRYRGAFFLARELSGLLVFVGLWVASLAWLTILGCDIVKQAWTDYRGAFAVPVLTPAATSYPTTAREAIKTPRHHLHF